MATIQDSTRVWAQDSNWVLPSLMTSAPAYTLDPGEEAARLSYGDNRPHSRTAPLGLTYVRDPHYSKLLGSALGYAVLFQRLLIHPLPLAFLLPLPDLP